MKKWINDLHHTYFAWRYKMLQRFMEHPHEVQADLFRNLIQAAKDTEWGKRYEYRSIRGADTFANRIPVQRYEDLQPFIERMMYGEKHVLWHGQVSWFSKSSGTTGAKSKFIPVSSQNLKRCHVRGSYDTMNLYFHQRPNARQFELKSMLMGGSLERFAPYPRTQYGDVSAIMIKHMSYLGQLFFIPNIETALMKEWEAKLERLAQAGAREPDVVMIGGVPTWTVVLFRRILEITGKNNMLEVWPNFQVYIHGGVSFTPYREQFREFFPSDSVDYLEIYNASEGYFAVQDDLSQEGMLLLLNNGMYYEFIPMSEWEKEYPKTVGLSEVELGKNYAIVISTNAGLWRYMPGDTVMFTSLSPYRIKVTGRTKQFVNAFGEEVMVENTDQALAATCAATGARVNEYTVAPVYFADGKRGGHEWLLEFEIYPEDINRFQQLLDQNLQQLNSDYEAKRYKDIALTELQLRPLPNGTFHRWMRRRGKLGGQHKVPRLANHREYVNEILNSLGEHV